MNRWFCIYSTIAGEFRALAGLQAKQFHVYMPIAVRTSRRSGWVVERRAPLLARYLFVNLSNFDRWDDMRSVLGVQEILPHDFEPLAIPNCEIEQLQEREAAGEFVFSETITGKRRERVVLRSLKELAFLQQLEHMHAS